jgi:site-specific DNA recombinase
MKYAVLYSRVSTDEQAKEGQSIESQIRICEQYAKDQGLKILQRFVDEGKSTTNMNRPALKDMLGFIQDKNNRVEIMLVQDTDRLARNTIDHLQIKALLKKHGVQLISVSQPIIDDSPEGNLIDTLLAATNAFQSQITGRKTSKVLEQKALMGWYPGGVPPLGYRNADNPASTSTLDRRIIIQDPTIAPVLKEVFQMYSTGQYSCKELAQYLNEKAIFSPTGSKIHTSLIARTLVNPFYIGKFVWNTKEYQGKHEPLVELDLFEAVTKVMNSHNFGASRKRKHNYLLRGFLFCAQCSNRMWAEPHVKADGKKYSFYYCKVCGKGTYADQNTIEKAVEAKIGEIKISDEYKQQIMTLAETMVEDSRQNRDIDKLRLDRERQKFEKALRDAEDDRYIHHSISALDFDRLAKRYQETLQTVNKQLEGLDLDYSSKLRSLERILALAEDLQRAYILAEPDMKREYLQMFFSRFEIKGEKIVNCVLSPDLEDLIKDGSVRVNTTGLPD